jgi:nitrite reductase/ring-hydroxylating ferredoxin subunit
MTERQWCPVASSADLATRHIFHTALHGQELALWRGDDGKAHVWENRCPHRGVRLSIGAHMGDGLRCQYHGWRFGGDGRCVAIPAHPDLTPSQGQRATTFPCVERFGLVWTSLGAAPLDLPDWEDGDWVVLRSLFVEAPAARVTAALPADPGLRFLVQPVNDGQSVLHGLSADRSISLRDQNDRLTRWRDAIEEQHT